VIDTPSSNTSVIVFDGICTMAMNAFLVGPFVAAFAFALGASHRDIGLISAIAFLSMPMQLVGAQLSVPLLSIRGLDFVFLISALAGLAAFQWLALIPEPGAAGNMWWKFKEELSLPFRRSPATASLREQDLSGV
jgi:hypothetical protein